MARTQLYQDSYRGGRGGQSASTLTGTIGAGLAADAAVLTLRYPLTGRGLLCVQRLRLSYVTVTAFTVPLTAGRALALVRGSGADATGGAALAPVRHLATGIEALATGRVATTAALTTTGITGLDSDRIARLHLAGAGSAGDEVGPIEWLFDGSEADPIYLAPGELIALVADSEFDAAGTWQLATDIVATEVL